MLSAQFAIPEHGAQDSRWRGSFSLLQPQLAFDGNPLLDFLSMHRDVVRSLNAYPRISNRGVQHGYYDVVPDADALPDFARKN
jgi:hypothetical protein